MDEPPRFYTTELAGYLAIGSDYLGLSVHVIDRADNTKIVGTFRTEDESNGDGWARNLNVRRKAQQLADELNAAQQ
jgi:hypothetical protein